VARPRVIESLKGALSHRLTSVVAGPGFGKTVALSALAQEVPTAWYTAGPEDDALPALAGGITDSIRLFLPTLLDEVRSVADSVGAQGTEESASAEALAALLCENLNEHLTHDLILIVDDVHEIGAGSGAARLLQGLCRHAPPQFHVVLASRKGLPFPIERLRGRGQVLDVDAAALAFDPGEVATILAQHGVEHEGLSDRLLEITRGWPAALRLIVETLRSVSAEELLEDPDLATKRNGHLHAYLAAEVLDAEPADVRNFLRMVSRIDRFNADLCTALGLRNAGAILTDLTRRGLFAVVEGLPGGWFRVPGLMRELIMSRFPLDAPKARSLLVRAAAWLRAHGHFIDALRSLQASGDEQALAEFLTQAGGVLFDAGHVRELIDTVASLPEQVRSPALDMWVGQAKQAQGDFEGALACFRRAGGDDDQLPPGLAWRMGQIHYLRGEPDASMSAYKRGRLDGEDTADEALLLAWTATLHWMQGDAESCRELSNRANSAAVASGDDRALAASHTILAMLAALDGDRRANDAHYLQALEAAERAGDHFQIVRIRTNRASHLYEEGWFDAARAELDIAIRLAELAGFTSLLPLALNNRGWTSYYRGRLEEAAADFERSRALYQRLDSRKIAYALEGLGAVYLQRGDLALARINFEEAVRQSESARDMQGLVPSLAGLARVVAAEDPARAASLCDRAIGFGPGMGHVVALLAGGWVTLMAGDRVSAAELGDSAATMARERRDRIGLAEALQLLAACEQGGRDQTLLDESRRIWHELGSPIGEAQAELALARLEGGPEGRARAETATRTLSSLGVRRNALAAGPLAALPAVAQPPASIQALGGFQVLREGCAMAISEWQSKKSRELLKILVARRGQPLHRERLTDLLWPEEDPGQVGSRLSVALSRIRAALDPTHRFPADHYVAGGEDSVALSIELLDIDVERFLKLAEKGLGLLREGRAGDAIPILQAAESIYAGDFLEEDAYEDWALSLREQARALYIAVTRGLAEAAAETGDRDTAVRFYLRALERDAYDEEAHLGLVSVAAAAGHHGEARRYYRAYVAKMDDIGVEAAPFPALARR
jgi:ATP/maltotriose-dependent transcriptional regulator MalT/DNA-binding SARP family transcriptional activator